MIVARCLALVAAVTIGGTCLAADLQRARQLEADRVAVVERISRSTIALFNRSASDGGSGVIVSRDGVALTNYHVVQPCGPRLLCGLNDGRVVEAVLLGADPAGDLAAIRLLGSGPFVPAELGDTRSATVGDPVIVAGNPLLIADDFTPSISVGVLSGKNRYQYPSEDLLEYADCLQTDAAINPGNSGGPLFDDSGRLLAIVGRASFEKRGRVSVGVGYAISIEQARRFLPALAGGCVPDHGSLGFTVRSVSGRLVGGPRIDRIGRHTLAAADGLRVGDEIVRIGDREVRSANDLQNTIGTLPAGWPVEVAYRRGGVVASVVIRLERQHEPGRLYDEVRKSLAKPEPPREALLPHYESGEGVANAVANRRRVGQILDAYAAHAERVRQHVIADAGRLDLRDAENNTRATLTVSDEALRWRSPLRDVRLLRGESFATQPSVGNPPSVLVGLAGWLELHANPPPELRYVGDLPKDPGGPLCPALRYQEADADTDFYFDRASGDLSGWSCRVRRDGREAEFSLLPSTDSESGAMLLRVRTPSDPDLLLRIGAHEP